ncbi:putative microtubule-associated protein, MAP65/Ase1/PRC1 [Lupinus albus]|uniref:Putative microtubule-associated protein, MAP65/Ase1/PRC1 n=1 Tax=Lupinus albus TaxID=3870 RepID=A0A6A4NBW8_LUPAL|nr:putative microtubule-associated protein, MAP65/Ase1/PRC1 [Lupinus albus]
MSVYFQGITINYDLYDFKAPRSDITWSIHLWLQDLSSQLIDLWNLMDTHPEERKLFDHVYLLYLSFCNDVTVTGALALDLIEQAEVEVDRLDH